MKTGLLNDVVTIQRLKPMPDDVYGTAKQEWEDVMTLRATIDYRGGDRVVENYEVVNTHLEDYHSFAENDCASDAREV